MTEALAGPRDAGSSSAAVRRYLAAIEAEPGRPPARDHGRPAVKRYPDAQRVVLPWPGPGRPALGDSTTERLSALLLGYGIRRFEELTSWSTAVLTAGTLPRADDPLRHLPGIASTHRTVPSGGNYHPGELYLAWGGSPEIPAGLYHFDPTHHWLELVRAGDHTAELAPVLGGPPVTRHLLLAAWRPWKNAGKYRAFGYRLAMLDSGVLLGQLLVSPAVTAVHLDIDVPAAEALLGLDGTVESVYAAAEVTFPGPESTGTAGGPPAPGTPAASARGLELDRLELGQSDPAVAALHRQIRAGARVRPAPGRHPAGEPAPAPASACRPTDRYDRGPATPVPLPPVPDLDLAGAAVRRASSFNLAPGLELSQLAGVLAAVTVPGSASPTGGTTRPGPLREIAEHPLRPSWWCQVAQVEGLTPGSYRYDPDRHALWPVPGTGPRVAEVSRLNPSMASAGAALFAVADGFGPVEDLDPAAYHRLYLLTGVRVHLACLAATAVTAGARPLLGYDPAVVAEQLGLSATQAPLMQILLARPRAQAGLLTARLTGGVSHA
ncbi:hypothetical protein [Micromonospora sp. NPDC047074]|uniref:hypothetical protein n=1 Tax=Micromonospora sp. NPDC047074 TaxID=3154339 RepID=UPI003407E627